MNAIIEFLKIVLGIEKQELSDFEKRKIVHEEYKEYYNTLAAHRFEVNSINDKTLILLDTGLIIASFTYIQFVDKLIQANYTGWIAFSWFAMLIAILLSIISQKLSCSLYDAAMELASLNYDKAIDGITFKQQKELDKIEYKTTNWTKNIKILNMFQLITTVSGIILFSIFVYFTYFNSL